MAEYEVGGDDDDDDDDNDDNNVADIDRGIESIISVF